MNELYTRPSATAVYERRKTSIYTSPATWKLYQIALHKCTALSDEYYCVNLFYASPFDRTRWTLDRCLKKISIGKHRGTFKDNIYTVRRHMTEHLRRFPDKLDSPYKLTPDYPTLKHSVNLPANPTHRDRLLKTN